MIKLIRKNQKFVMVILGIVLMVMFISNIGPQGTQTSSPVLRQVATLGSAKITQLQLNIASDEWQTLKTLEFVSPNEPTDKPTLFVVQVLGQQLANQIETSQKSGRDTPLFFLLIQEANRQGLVVSDEELESIITNNVTPSGEPGTEERQRVEDAVRDGLLIQKLASRADSVIKISKPYREFELANLAQELSVKAETIRADSLLDQIPAPTDAEISAQFDKYIDRVAAVAERIPSEFGQTDDPLGFGYKIPNRVSVQYIGISFPDVKKAAVASKSVEDWYVAAFGEFKANRADYDGRPVPTTRIASSTQPISGVKALDGLEDDFTIHAPIVLAKLYQQQVDTLEENILREINEKLSSGFGTYRDAVAATGNSGNLTAPAADYVSFKYMRDVADSIAQKYGVTPIIGNIQQYKSEAQLTEIEGIGTAGVPVAGGSVDFPFYAVRLFQPWLSDADKNSQRGALAIAPWQPSNPIEDQQQNTYIFRISGNEAAHEPNLSDVKDQVVSDCKISAAYAKALQIGKLLLSSANNLGLDKAVSRTKLAPPILTDSFSPEAIRTGRAPAVIEPLILASDSARQLAGVSQELLTTPPTKDNRRQLLAELYADRTVAVIELREAKPAWDADSKPMFTAQVTQLLEREQQVPLELSLFKPEDVVSRLDYKVIAK
jgi:hypothetical protein